MPNTPQITGEVWKAPQNLTRNGLAVPCGFSSDGCWTGQSPTVWTAFRSGGSPLRGGDPWNLVYVAGGCLRRSERGCVSETAPQYSSPSAPRNGPAGCFFFDPRFSNLVSRSETSIFSQGQETQGLARRRTGRSPHKGSRRLVRLRHVDAEIAEKDHFWTEPIEYRDYSVSPSQSWKWVSLRSHVPARRSSHRGDS